MQVENQKVQTNKNKSLESVLWALDAESKSYTYSKSLTAEEAKSKLTNCRVVILGVGGIGSHVALALCRAGVGQLKLIDLDAVEESNLGRQCYTYEDIGVDKTKALKDYLNLVNPHCQIETQELWLTEDNIAEILDDEEFIIEAFDNARTKAELTPEILALPKLKMLIGCSGMAGWGDANLIQRKKLRKNWYICGDFTSDIKELGKITAARVMICAGQMANQMLNFLLLQSSEDAPQIEEK